MLHGGVVALLVAAARQRRARAHHDVILVEAFARLAVTVDGALERRIRRRREASRRQHTPLRHWAEAAVDLLNPFDRPVWLLFSAATGVDGDAADDARALGGHERDALVARRLEARHSGCLGKELDCLLMSDRGLNSVVNARTHAQARRKAAPRGIEDSPKKQIRAILLRGTFAKFP